MSASAAMAALALMNSALTPVLLLAMSYHAIATEIVAHRGYSAVAPENTLAAFKLAWEKGSDACENDIYLTADGQIICIHDKDTQRTAPASPNLLIAKATAAQLAQHDVGTWKHPRYASERIPTLQQALDTMPQGQQRFFIEIKVGAEIVPALTSVLASYRSRAAQLAIITFQHDAAVAAKKALPWVPLYYLAAGKDKKTKKPRTDLAKLIADAQANHFDGLDLGLDWPWSEAMVKQVHEAGLKLFVWTANKPADIARLAALGVDGITTDDPVLAREALKTQP